MFLDLAGHQVWNISILDGSIRSRIFTKQWNTSSIETTKEERLFEPLPTTGDWLQVRKEIMHEHFVIDVDRPSAIETIIYI